MAEQTNVVDEAAEHLDDVIGEVLNDGLSLDDRRQVLMRLRDNVSGLLDETVEALLRGDDLDGGDEDDEDEDGEDEEPKAGA